MGSPEKGLVTHLGQIFSLLEQKPEILEQLPFAIKLKPENLSSLPFTLEVPSSLDPTLSQLPQNQIDRIRIRFDQIKSHLADRFSLNDLQVFYLSYLVSRLEDRERQFIELDGQHSTEEDFSKLATLRSQIRNRPGHRQFLEALLKPRGFVLELGEDYEEMLDDLFSEGGTLEEEDYRFGLDALIRAIDDLSVPEPGVPRGKLKEIALYIAANSTIAFFTLVPHLIEENESSTNRSASGFIVSERQRVMNFMEDLYFKTELSKFNHQAYMDVLDFLIYGQPIPYSPSEVLLSMTEMAKTALLPAKNYLSNLNAEKRKLEQPEKPLVKPFVLKISERSPPQKANKKKGIRSPKPSLKESESVSDSSPSQTKNSYVSYTKYATNRRGLRDLRAEEIYQYSFLRDPSDIIQSIKFSDEILKALQANPSEAYPLLDSLALGFTDKSHHGAGLKRLKVKTSRLGEALYEARPNRGHYRMILMRDGEVWVPIAFTKKIDFEKTLEVIRRRH